MTMEQLLLSLVVLTVAVLALIWVFQRRLIYLPTQVVPPAGAVLPGAQEVSFETESGLRLAGWFVAGEGSGRRAAAVVFNGNAGNRAFRAPLAAELARAGLSVLLFDYRGFGGNPGSPSEKGLLADGRAARAYLASREDVDDARIVYFGESLGTGVAVALAVESASGGPAVLVLQSPFTSMTDMGRLYYPFLPVRLLLRDRYPVLDRIGRVAAPVLVIAAERDEIVPVGQSRRVYEAAPEPKRWLLIHRAGHNDLRLVAGARLVQQLLGFLAEHSAVMDSPRAPGGR